MSERIERQRDRELGERRFSRDAHGKSRPAGFVGRGAGKPPGHLSFGYFSLVAKEKYLALQGETRATISQPALPTRYPSPRIETIPVELIIE
jgi:hypothetical protein